MAIPLYAQIGVKTAFPQEGYDVAVGVQLRNNIRLGGSDSSKGNAGVTEQLIISQGENKNAQWNDLRNLPDYQKLVDLLNQLRDQVKNVYTGKTPVYAYAEEERALDMNSTPVQFISTRFESIPGLLSNGVFTAPENGFYRVASRWPIKQVGWTTTIYPSISVDNGARIKLKVYVNDIQQTWTENQLVQKGHFQNLSETVLDKIIKLNKGDKVKIIGTYSYIKNPSQTGYLDSTAGYDVKDQGYPYFSIAKIN